MKTGRIISLLLCILLAERLLGDDYALEFDGAGDHVLIGQPVPVELQLTDAFTIEARIYPYSYPGTSTLGGIVACQHDGTASGYSMMLDGRPAHQIGGVHAQIGNSSSYFATSSEGTTAAIVPLERWTHVVFAWSNGGSPKVYLDGTAVTDWRNWTGPVAYNSSNRLAFGGHIDFGNRYFSGLIDQVRIWDRELSPEEIEAGLFQVPAGTETGLVGLWTFDEGNGSIASDGTENDNDGVLYGGPHWVMIDLMTSVQPDLLIRTDDETEYTGDGVYGNISLQTKNQVAGAGAVLIYELQLQNERIAADRFLVTGDGGKEHWLVEYHDAATGNDITAEVSSNGWTTPIIASGGQIELLMKIEPKVGVSGGDTAEIVVQATSESDASKHDAVRAQATFSVSEVAPLSRTYTLNADFDLGTMIGVEYEGIPDQLQLSEEATTLPFIWVPNSIEATVSKVDTKTGKELGRYRTGPTSSGNPSRTTVDLYGNCWVGNRGTGTVVKIGLLENGQHMDRNNNDVIETSRDLNGDGDITGDEILPWASDECVLYEIVLTTGSEGTYIPGQYQGSYSGTPVPRAMAIDRYNNVWAGCFGSMKYYYINGLSGSILKAIDVSSINHTPYGAVVDGNGLLWSSGHDDEHVLWLDPSDDSFAAIPLGHFSYGLGMDHLDHLFVSGWTDSKLSRIDILSRTLQWTKDAVNGSKGVACTLDGDVWVAEWSQGTVTRWSNDGEKKDTITVGAMPAGVSVDSEGKVWVVNYGDEYIKRIDPDTNSIDLQKAIAGGTRHYGYSDMTGIIARSATTKIGTWTIRHNSKASDASWGAISWNSHEPWGTTIRVKVRSSEDRNVWSWWEDMGKDSALRHTPNGRYLEIQATFDSEDPNVTPILYDLTVNPSPCCGDVEHLRPRSDNNNDCRVDLYDFGWLTSEWLDCTAPACN